MLVLIISGRFDTLITSIYKYTSCLRDKLKLKFDLDFFKGDLQKKIFTRNVFDWWQGDWMAESNVKCLIVDKTLKRLYKYRPYTTNYF